MNPSPTKRRIMVFGLLAVGSLTAAFWFIGSRNNPSLRQSDGSLEGIKNRCRRIITTSPFRDSQLGIEFTFSENHIVCDASPVTFSGKPGREIMLWKKDSFRQADPTTFGSGVVGLIIPDAPADTYSAADISNTESGTIAGQETAIMTVRWPNCPDGACPTYRAAELYSEDHRITVLEHDPQASMFESITFIPTE
jgi:hypothetical protein